MSQFFKIKENRIEWIDVSRGIGIIFVILGHLRFPYLTTWIYTFHMPLFFFLSGCVYKRRSFKEFILKNIKSCFIPYWTLGVVIWGFYVIVNLFVGEKGLYGSNLEMLWNLVKQQGYWTIWFLACLFISQILFFVIDRLSNDKDYLGLLLSSVVCIAGFVYYRFGGHVLPWNIDIACIAQFFMRLGYLFMNCKKCKEFMLECSNVKCLIISATCLLINVATGFLCIRLSGHSLDMSIGMYGNEMLTVISAISGLLFVISVANRFHWSPLVYLGQNTLIIFAWHSRIIIVLMNYSYKALGLFQNDDLISQIVQCSISFVIILIVLIPITELIKKSKLHKWFGV